MRQNLNLIHDFDPDLVVVFGADHIYRMDIGQMVQWHIEKDADVTVSTIPVPSRASLPSASCRPTRRVACASSSRSR